jgi:hypothetical protein
MGMRKILSAIYAWTAIEVAFGILAGIVVGIIVTALVVYGGAAFAYWYAHMWE